MIIVSNYQSKICRGGRFWPERQTERQTDRLRYLNVWNYLLDDTWLYKRTVINESHLLCDQTYTTLYYRLLEAGFLWCFRFEVFCMIHYKDDIKTEWLVLWLILNPTLNYVLEPYHYKHATQSPLLNNILQYFWTILRPLKWMCNNRTKRIKRKKRKKTKKKTFFVFPCQKLASGFNVWCSFSVFVKGWFVSGFNHHHHQVCERDNFTYQSIVTLVKVNVCVSLWMCVLFLLLFPILRWSHLEVVFHISGLILFCLIIPASAVSGSPASRNLQQKWEMRNFVRW